MTSDASNIDSILISASEQERTDVSKWLSKLTDGTYTLEKATFTSADFGDISQILLRDRWNDAVVRFSDVGVGLSQLLPILVNLLIKRRSVGGRRTFRRRLNDVLIVEQPELHLHPVMQADLGDLFASQIAAKGTREQQQIIVETHSENLLLRVKKLLREKVLATPDISIVYVSRFPGGGSLAQPIRVADDGRLRDELPLDFVNLRAREIYDE
jgi:predicted ATPase